jgi:hypothetical protein
MGGARESLPDGASAPAILSQPSTGHGAKSPGSTAGAPTSSSCPAGSGLPRSASAATPLRSRSRCHA